MLPFIEIGSFSISSFALARTYAAAAVAYLFWIQWRADPALGKRRWMAAVLVLASTIWIGLYGSKLWRLIRLEIFGSYVSDPVALNTGSTWLFAGMVLALLGGAPVLALARVPVLKGLDFFAPGFAVGQGIHRIGCLLSGDGCYGPPTDVPWGIAFPHGTVPTSIPVHPTMLYEALWLFGVFALLWMTRHSRPEGDTFALFIVLTAVGCFLTQFLYLTPPLAWGLTEAQLQGLILIPLGLVKLLSLLDRMHKRV